MTFEQIYKQALVQGKTGNMTLKEFKKKMKELGYTANSKNARAYFYKEEDKNIPVEKRSLEVEILTPTQFSGKIGNSGVQEGMVIGGPNMNFDLALNLATNLGLKTFTYANDGKLKMTWNHPNARKAIKKYEAPDLDKNKFELPLAPLFPLSYYDLMVLKGKVEPNNFQFETLYKKQGGKMTLKFQQGGQASSLDAVMQFVQALAQTLQADPNQVILAAQLNPDALKSAVEVYQQTLDIQQAAQAFSQALRSQARAARHGAKLNYLKTLKNQCAEDEELVYFKKGGKVGCGCRKKNGGELKSDKKESAVEKFKKACGGSKMLKPGGQTPVINKNDSIPTNSNTLKFKKTIVKKENKLDPETTKVLPNGKYPSNWTSDDKIKWERKFGPKDEGAHYAKEEKCGGKMKKHQHGGSLNGIPFYLEGTNRYGIRTKELVEAINNLNINNAKGLFKGIISGEVPPTIPNIGRMISSAYKGWLEPETTVQTGMPPSVGVTKAKNALEALQMVKAMKAEKVAKTAKESKAVIKSPKPKSIATGPKTVKLGKGYSALIEVPLLDNYQELFDAYKMTRASRLNINNILDKLPAEERANVLKVMMNDPDKYLGKWIGNVTPARAASSITNIRRRLPGEYTPLRVKSLDLTRPNMGTGVFLKFDDATSKTAGFKRTTKVKY